MAKYTNTVEFKLKTSYDQSGFVKMKKQLQELRKEAEGLVAASGGAQTYKDDIKNIDALTRALEKSKTGLSSMNLRAFNDELKKAGVSLSQFYSYGERYGRTGLDVINSLNKSIVDSTKKVATHTSQIERLTNTFWNTARWSIVTQAFQGIMSSVYNAVNYVEKLDESLTNIMMVTDYSRENMQKFAKEANNAAKALGATTTDYTNATLVFAQQGFSLKESQNYATLSTQLAKVSQQSTSDASDEITAYMNAYGLDGKVKELADALGAWAQVANDSAADVNELAIATQKSASTAKTVGVSMDQLNATIATIESVTKDAPENIGNGLKTIYARFASLAMGEDLEDGVTLNDVQKALQKIGISILNADGQMKNVGDVIEETMAVWSNLSMTQQNAVATTLAGKYQLSRFEALMNRPDLYQTYLTSSQNADITNMEDMYADYMSSIEAKMNQVRANIEVLFNSIYDSDLIEQGTEAAVKFTDALSSLFKMFDDGTTLVPLLAGAFGKLFAGTATRQIVESVKNRQELNLARSNANVIKKSTVNGVFDLGILEKIPELEKMGVKRGKEVQESLKRNGTDVLSNVRMAYSNQIGFNADVLSAKDAGVISEEEWEKLEKHVERYGELIEIVIQKQTRFEEELDNIEEGSDRYNELVNDLNDAAEEANNFAKEIKDTDNYLREMTSISNLTSALSNFVFTGAMAATAIQSITDSLNTYNDTSLTAEERSAALNDALTQIMFTAATIGPSVVDIIKKLQTVHRDAGIINTISMMLGKIPGPLMAIAAAIALIGGIGYAVYKQHQDEILRTTKALEKQKEQLTETNKLYNESKAELDELNSSIDEISNNGDAFEGLTEGTEEWKDALVAANDLVLSLLEKYPELAGYLEKGEHGELSISDEGFDFIQQEKANQAINAGIAKAAAFEGVKNAEIDKAIQDAFLKNDVEIFNLLERGEFVKEYGRDNVDFYLGGLGARQKNSLGSYSYFSKDNAYDAISAALYRGDASNKYKTKQLKIDSMAGGMSVYDEYVVKNANSENFLKDFVKQLSPDALDDLELSEEEISTTLKALGIDLDRTSGEFQDLAYVLKTFNENGGLKSIKDNIDASDAAIEAYKDAIYSSALELSPVLKDANSIQKDMVKDRFEEEVKKTAVDMDDVKQWIEKNDNYELDGDVIRDAAGEVAFDLSEGIPPAVASMTASWLAGQHLEEYLNEITEDADKWIALSGGDLELAAYKYQHREELKLGNGYGENITNMQTAQRNVGLSLLGPGNIQYKNLLMQAYDEYAKYGKDFGAEIGIDNLNKEELEKFLEQYGKGYLDPLRASIDQQIEATKQNTNAYSDAAFGDAKLSKDSYGEIASDGIKGVFENELLSGNSRTAKDAYNLLGDTSSFAGQMGIYDANLIANRADNVNELSKATEEYTKKLDEVTKMEGSNAQKAAEVAQAMHDLSDNIHAISLDHLADSIDHIEGITEAIDDMRSALRGIQADDDGNWFVDSWSSLEPMLKAYPDLIEEIEVSEEGYARINKEHAQSIIEATNAEMQAKAEQAKQEAEATIAYAEAREKEVDAEIAKVEAKIASAVTSEEADGIILESEETLAKNQIAALEDVDDAQSTLAENEIDYVNQAEGAIVDSMVNAANVSIDAASKVNDAWVGVFQNATSNAAAFYRAMREGKEFQIKSDIKVAAASGSTTQEQAQAGKEFGGYNPETPVDTIDKSGVQKLEEYLEKLRGIKSAYANMRDAAQASIVKNSMSLNSAINEYNNIGKTDGASGSKTDTKLVDKYLEINQVLEKRQKILSRINREENRLAGNALIGKIKTELKAQKELNEAYAEKAAIAEKIYNDAAGALNAFGVTINGDGTIDQKSADAVAQRLLDAGDTDTYDAFMDALDETTKAYGDWLSSQEELAENIDKQWDIIDKLYNAMWQATELFKKSKDIANNLDSISRWFASGGPQASSLVQHGNQHLFNLGSANNAAWAYRQNAATYGRYQNQYAAWQRGEATELFGGLNGTKRVDAGTALKRMTDAAEKIKNSAEEVKGTIEALYQDVITSIEDVNKLFDERTKAISNITRAAQNAADIATLLYGEGSDRAFNISQRNSRIQVNANQSLIKTLQGQVAAIGQEMAGLAKDSDEYKQLQQQQIDIEAQIQDTIKDSITQIKQMYNQRNARTINNAFDNVFGGDLDWVANEWELITRNAELYLDDVNRAYEIQKLQSKYLELADGSNDLQIQQQITEQMEEQLGYLRSKANLSAYDVAYAEAQLEILKKQIALEDAQANKSKMRLRRDSQGNYSYTYVGNEDNIRDAESVLLDAQNNAYNLSKNAMIDAQGSAISTAQNAKASILEIAASEVLTQEQKSQRIREIVDRLNEYLEAMSEKIGTSSTNILQDVITFGQNILFENQGNLTNILTDITNGNEDAWSRLDERFDTSIIHGLENIDLFTTTFSGMCDDININLEDLSMALEEMLDEAGYDIENLCEGAMADAEDKLKDLDEAYGDFDTAAKDAIDNVMSYMNDYADLMDSIAGQVSGDLSKISDTIADLENEANRVSKLSKSIKQTQKVIEGGNFNGSSSDGISGNGAGSSSVASAEATSLSGASSKKTTSAISSTIGTGPWYTNSNGETWYKTATSHDAYMEQEGNGAVLRKTFNAGSIFEIVKDTNTKDGKIMLREKNGYYLYANLQDLRAKKFDTGGYTGTWLNGGIGADNGKLAILHQKELVLNEQQTKAIMPAISLLKDMSNIMKSSALSPIANSTLGGHSMLNGLGKEVVQNISISADFPAVQTALEIENALKNLTNQAYQYAMKSY